MIKINSLQVNLTMHTESYVVGEVPCYITQRVNYKDDLMVSEIKDCSMEYEDSIHPFYEIYANGQLYRRIEYSPVTIGYERVLEE
ncbi:hypothetical protein MKZ08_08370 [Viridibacillus sp. FSL R5-0477]|uniref:Uncharacterized protein n=1 Tax=Viridibacillus arenosi FSL R5-213 TaxID=1227360 RepID=W4EVB4_9BACL|nr:hypothetical protein [Viridibacillus arenosi]ETT84194.1 hypothetical protein C176_12538 [Viridibacillus arenosi FSL R5-213]OMC90012.1 hypothetical protein BK137_14790 [Viridibacillus arenosi]